MQPEVFRCFLTAFDQYKKYVLFCNSRLQRKIKKQNLSFGYGNWISFIFGLKTSFEVSEGQLKVSCLSGRQIISYNKDVVLVILLL